MKTEPVRNSKTHTRYYDRNNTLVPGVTTILGVLNKPALVPWANRLGLQGIDSSKYVDGLATIGTLAHYMITCYLQNEKPDLKDFTPNEIDRAENSFLKYLDWEKKHKIKVIACEQPLVSEEYKFGGTIDGLMEVDGVLEIVDFKTGKAIYDEMLHQVSAYRTLAIENNFPVKQVRILQIGREESEGFSEKPLADTLKHWKVFEHCLEIYKLQRELRRG